MIEKTPADTKQQQPRRKFWRTLLLILLLPFDALLVLIALLHIGPVQQLVIGRSLDIVSKAIGREIACDELRFSLFSGSIWLHHASFENPDTFELPHTGRIEYLYADVALLESLWQQKLIVTNVNIVRPEFYLLMDQNKVMNITGKGPVPPHLRRRPKNPMRPEKILEIFFDKIQLERVRIQNPQYFMQLDFVPMTLRVRDGFVNVDWNERRGIYDVALDIKDINITIVDMVHVHNNLSSPNVWWHRKGWTSREMHIGFFDSNSTIDVTYVDFRELLQQIITVRTNASIELTDVHKIVRLPYKYSGKVDFSAEMSGRAADFEIRVNATGNDVQSQWGGVEYFSSNSTVRIDEVVVHDFSAFAAGGEATGLGKVGWGSEFRGLDFRGHLFDVRVDEVLDGFDMKYSAPLQTDANFTLVMKDFLSSNLAVDGWVKGAGELPGSEKQLKLNSDFRLTTSTLSLTETRANYEGVSINFGGDYAFSGNAGMDFAGDFRVKKSQDLSDLMTGLFKFWERNPKADVFELDSVLQGGTANGKFTLKGPPSDFIIDGDLAARELRITGLNAREVTTKVHLKDGLLKLDELTLDTGQKSIRTDFSLNINQFQETKLPPFPTGGREFLARLADWLRAFPETSLPLEIDPFDLGKFLEPANEAFEDLGMLSGVITFQKTSLKSMPTGSFQLKLGPGSYMDQYYDRIELDGTLKNEILTLDITAMSPVYGKAVVSGDINLKESMNLLFDIPGIEFSSLPGLEEAGVEGVIAVNGEIQGTPSAPEVHGLATWQNLEYNGYSHGKGSVNFRFEDDKVSLLGTVANDQLVVDAGLYMPPGQEPIIELSADFNSWELQSLILGIANTDRAKLPLAPTISGRINLQGPLNTPKNLLGDVDIYDCQIQYNDLVFSSERLLNASIEDGILKVHKINLSGEGLVFDGGGIMDTAGTIDMEVNTFVDLNLLEQFNFGITDIYGQLIGSARLFGTVTEPNFTAEIDVNSDRLVLAFVPDVAFTVSGDVHLSLSPERVPDILEQGVYSLTNTAVATNLLRELIVDVRSLDIATPGSSVQMQGIMPYDRDNPLSMEGKVDLKLIQKILPFISFAEGVARVEGQVRGTVLDPQYTMLAEMRSNPLRLNFLPLTFNDFYGFLTIENDVIALNEVTASVGGGSAEMNGEIYMNNFSPESLDIGMNFQDVNHQPAKGAFLRASGNLRMTGPPMTPLIDGTVQINRLRYVNPISYQSMILETSYRIVVTGTRKLEPEKPWAFDPRFQISIQAPETIEINNNMAEITMSSDMTLINRLNSPALTGRMEVNGGQIFFQGQTFNVKSGTLNFISTDKINPYIDIQASGRIDKYEVLIQVEGELEDNLLVSLSSDPPLDPNEVYSLILTGSLPGEGTVTTDFTQTDRAISIISGYFSNQIEDNLQILGIDKFSIEPSLSSDEQLARLTVGKKISDRLSLLYSTDVPASQRQVILIKFDLTDNIVLVGERKDDGNLGADVRFRFEFR